ncbi:MAG: hypothetical protein FWB80_00710 [Defluviitaleaceae bacterium]|nr:hypothetical protein [Defluviitaleaceae bacterium]
MLGQILKKISYVIFFFMIILLAGCESHRNTPKPSPELDLPTLDRRTFVDEMIRLENRQIIVPHYRTERFFESGEELTSFIILDDNVYMGNFLRVGTDADGNNRYEDILRTLNNLFPFSYYYRLSEGGGASPVETRFLFDNARDVEFYRRSDSVHLSPLSGYMYEFLNIHYDSLENQIFILVTDMDLSGGVDDAGIPNEFVALLSRFIKNSRNNVGIIGIQSEYLGNITAMPELLLDANADIVGIYSSGNTVNRFHVNYGNPVYRPVYLLFIGSSNAVRDYMNRFKERFPNVEDLSRTGEYRYFIFDDLPSHLPIPIQIQLSTITPELNNALDRYAFDVEGLLHLVSDSLTGDAGISREQITWDNRITDLQIPFWRIYSGFRNSSNFTDGQRPGLRITLNETHDTLLFDEYVNIRMFTANGDWINNPVSHIYATENRASRNQIDFEIIPSSFVNDEPKIFVVDVERRVINEQVSYRFQRFRDFRWIEDWTLDLRLFRDEAYLRNQEGIFEFTLWTPPYVASDNFSQAHRTPFLNNLFDRLITLRTDFIQNTLYQERVAYTSHQYAIFGFVARDRYVMHFPNALNNETGGFAFSTYEIQNMNREGN